MRTKTLAWVVFLLVGSSTLSAREFPSLFSIGAGLFNFKMKTHNRRALYQAEYKWGFSNCLVRPQIGAFTADFHIYFIYAGIGFDFFVTDHFVITPSFSPGYYNRGSRGRDLGYPLEFRSCLELAWNFPRNQRLGVQVYHLSNASLGERNPGVNCFSAFFSIPLSKNLSR